MKKLKTILFVLGALLFTHYSKSQAVAKDTVKKIADQAPFDNMDQSWMNGSDRRDSSVFHIPYFNPSIFIDANATYSFTNPNDHTVVGSTALARDNEMEVSAASFGG